jgi:hypothetical protein
MVEWDMKRKNDRGTANDIEMRGYVIVENVYSDSLIKKNQKGALLVLGFIFFIILLVTILITIETLNDISYLEIIIDLILIGLMIFYLYILIFAIVHWMTKTQINPKIYSNGILHREHMDFFIKEEFIPFHNIDKVFLHLDSTRLSLVADLKRKKRFEGKTATEYRLSTKLINILSRIDKNHHLYIITKNDGVIEWDRSWITEPAPILQAFTSKNIKVY